jgi:hypothetical protein
VADGDGGCEFTVDMGRGRGPKRADRTPGWARWLRVLWTGFAGEPFTLGDEAFM